MEWTTRMHHDAGYLEVVTRGLADEEGSLKMAAALSTTMREARITRVLIDHRAVTAVAGTAIAVQERPRIFRLLGVLLRVRIAELIHPRHREHFRFFETVCANRGFKIGVFYEPADAVQWLLK